MAAFIAWLNALVPILAVTGAYIIAIALGYGEVCNPFISGCTSISRAARFGDAVFWFRGLMLPVSSFLIIYWIYQYHWLKQYGEASLHNKIILALGIGSALALTFYANFLGSDGDVYRFMRRFGVTFYFGFAVLAQLLSIASIRKSARPISGFLSRILRWQFFCVIGQWLIGLASLGVTYTQPDFRVAANNILEWNFALLMTGFYIGSGLIWKYENYRPNI